MSSRGGGRRRGEAAGRGNLVGGEKGDGFCGVNGSLVYRSYRAESSFQRSASGDLSSDRAVS